MQKCCIKLKLLILDELQQLEEGLKNYNDQIENNTFVIEEF